MTENLSKEFSNEFDTLYNNINSNQAPGLDEYEKSIFLTKAQDEILKAYFTPILNKTQQGFDDSERRQIDFSMITKVETYEEEKSPDGGIVQQVFYPGVLDNRNNTKMVKLESDILFILNEFVDVKRGKENPPQTVRLSVIPMDYTQYSIVMTKPYKRPLKYQAWRLINNKDNNNYAELIIGPNDTLFKYSLRYIRQPRPIILDNFTESGITINGKSTESTCELDPILHREIIQRAVELASAVYKGDLAQQLALGVASQTNIGMVQSSK